MHVHFLDPYQPRASLLHQLDARIKLALTLMFILTTALTPHNAWPVYLLLLSVILAVGVLSELGLAFVLKRSTLAFIFVLAAVPVIFTLQGQTLFLVKLGAWSVPITQPGLERFVSITLKSWISVQAAILLTASTPFPELLTAMRALRLPRLLVAIIGLMWRYLFVLVDEAFRLTRARAARSGQSDQPNLKTGGSLVWRARVAGGMAGNLFLRAFDRSDRIYMAMLARGYDGEARSLPTPALSKTQLWILIAFSTMFAVLIVISLLIWG